MTTVEEMSSGRCESGKACMARRSVKRSARSHNKTWCGEARVLVWIAAVVAVAAAGLGGGGSSAAAAAAAAAVAAGQGWAAAAARA